MKLNKLIEKLTRIKNEYVEKYGTEPEIFSFDDEGILLCSKIEKYKNEKLNQLPSGIKPIGEKKPCQKIKLQLPLAVHL